MNKTLTSVVGLVLAGALLAPLSVSATVTPNNFCTRLPGRSASIETALEAREAAVDAAQARQLARIAKDRAEQDHQMELNRARFDAQLARRIDNLEARARTNAQRQAVTAYQNAITAALTAHRSAVDAAYVTYRTGVDAVVAQRQTGMDAIVDSFKAAVSAAIARANSDCTNHVRPTVAQDTFQHNLDTARATFHSQRNHLPTIDAPIAALQVTLNNSVRTAAQTFRTAAAAAKAALQTAF